MLVCRAVQIDKIFQRLTVALLQYDWSDYEWTEIRTGLKITAGHRTMSGQDDYLSGQNLGLAVILTGQVRGFQVIH